MNVVSVIPLIRGSQLDTLSYYTSQTFPLGTIITVPIRNQQKPAVVLKCAPGSATKAALRAATFRLRKLPEQHECPALPAALLQTAQTLVKHTPAELGAIVYALLPKEVREGDVTIATVSGNYQARENTDITVLTGTYEDRYRSYRSRIRETFAHRGSVLFVVPTTADVERARTCLERGIEKRIVTFSAALTKKKLHDAYADFQDVTHAKLVITTPSHAFLDRHDFTDIIIDQSRSRAYKSRFRPYLDIRECLKHLARHTGRRVVLGDLVPRTEDEYLRREDIYETEGDVPKRLTVTGRLEVVEPPATRSASDKFELFFPPVLKELASITSKRKNIFIYAARRGLAPVVTCVDCGYIFRCPDSGAPYTLFKTEKNGEEQRWFVAAASGRRLRAPDTCPQCSSWRLRERGIGIQHIEKELRAQFPTVPLILFDHTTATTLRKATQLVSTFYETKGAIMLGTAMALPYLERPIPYTIVTSLDAARSVPTWRAEEELFSLLMQLREKTEEVCYLQTRSAPDEVVGLAVSAQIEAFYDGELALREQLKYPPFSIFVHLTLAGTAQMVQKLETELDALLLPWKPRFYHAPTTTSAKATRYGLLRIPRHAWPDEKLMHTLRSLPPNVRIEVNPDRII